MLFKEDERMLRTFDTLILKDWNNFGASDGFFKECERILWAPSDFFKRMKKSQEVSLLKSVKESLVFYWKQKKASESSDVSGQIVKK